MQVMVDGRALPAGSLAKRVLRSLLLLFIIYQSLLYISQAPTRRRAQQQYQNVMRQSFQYNQQMAIQQQAEFQQQNQLLQQGSSVEHNVASDTDKFGTGEREIHGHDMSKWYRALGIVVRI